MFFHQSITAGYSGAAGPAQTASTEASFPAAAQCRVTLPAAAAQAATSADPATSAATAATTPTVAAAATTAAATATANHTPKLQHQHEHQQPEAGGRQWDLRQCGWHSGQLGWAAVAIADHHTPELRGDTTLPNGDAAAAQYRANPSNAGAMLTALVLPTAAAATAAGSPTATPTGSGYGRCVDDGTNATIPTAIDTTTCVLQ